MLLTSGDAGFRVLVTPNVDHIVQLSKRPELVPIYEAADWRMCDSRIIERLGRMSGIELRCYPGADLVRDLLDDPLDEAAVRSFVDVERYPHHDLVLVEAPFMAPGSPEWEATLRATETTGADLTLLCISFPKQEIFARDLKARGVARGAAIAAGASIDFLTGHQKRAPEIFRRIGMEWLYRLLSQPGRLWKRYLVDGPRIFLIYYRSKG
jgi:UDP-N-acetyl-D-mannosaminuronic acid transferase (WecB/TagA/CpsF family)